MSSYELFGNEDLRNSSQFVPRNAPRTPAGTTDPALCSSATVSVYDGLYIPDRVQFGHLPEQFKTLRRQSARSELRTAAAAPRPVFRISERKPDHAYAAPPPFRQVTYVLYRVRALH